jgi:hypothetical protein
MQRVSRRRVVGGSVGFGAGVFAAGKWSGRSAVSAQEATPESAMPALGYVSLRLRQLAAPELVPEVNEIVVSDFVPSIQAQPWFRGYLLGNVQTDSTLSLSVAILNTKEDTTAFDAAAQEFIGGLDPQYVPETPAQEEGDLFIASSPASLAATPSAATPVATPIASPATSSGFITLHLFTDPSFNLTPDTIAKTQDDLLPILSTFPGLQGFLWFLVDDGFATITLFEDEAVAMEAAAFERGWTQVNVPGLARALPELISAAVVFADLPILTVQPG